MSTIIEELKDEHKSILAVLDQVRALGIASAPGRERLLSARDLLLAHMTREDEQYYPALRQAAEHSRELQVLLEFFVRDMENVSRKALQFFEKYSRGGNEEEFAGEIKLLYLTLRDRVRTEEEVLFARFDRI